jgi:hypothetical protein
MPLVLALQLLRHPEWSGWYDFLALFLVRSALSARGWETEAYILSYRAELAARTRRNGRLPRRGTVVPLIPATSEQPSVPIVVKEQGKLF